MIINIYFASNMLPNSNNTVLIKKKSRFSGVPGEIRTHDPQIRNLTPHKIRRGLQGLIRGEKNILQFYYSKNKTKRIY